jgi:hypothetical protein
VLQERWREKMFKNKAIIFVLLIAILASGKAFCQQEIEGMQKITIAGKVTGIDEAGSVINVQTDSGQKIALYISVESVLFRYAHHKGDPVIIQYASTSSGKNIIIRLEDTKPDSI